ncbi:MAG: hypothetical protein AAFY71_04090 [Bacteroidota bacterium]
MVRVQYKPIEPKLEKDILDLLTYKGKIPAMKRYIEMTGARVHDAKVAVDRLSREIQPGQAS